ncbi:MAG: hypothetical protein P1P73_09665 [Brevefilum sp.]|nr:hypothetical protein [Brevefilum sp.]
MIFSKYFVHYKGRCEQNEESAKSFTRFLKKWCKIIVDVEFRTYTEKELVEVEGFIFSKGWNLVMPGIKEERYEIRPIMDGQVNLAYFELLAEIINPSGERVGYCFVELLPGVRNPGKKPSFKKLLMNV